MPAFFFPDKKLFFTVPAINTYPAIRTAICHYLSHSDTYPAINNDIICDEGRPWLA